MARRWRRCSHDAELMLALDVGIWPQERFVGQTSSFSARAGEPKKSFSDLYIHCDEVMQEFNVSQRRTGKMFRDR